MVRKGNGRFGRSMAICDDLERFGTMQKRNGGEIVTNNFKTETFLNQKYHSICKILDRQN